MEILDIKNVSKSFTLHAQGGIRIPVIQGVSLTVSEGEAIALSGPSGSGKSSLMRMIYGNYLCPQGALKVRHQDEWIDLTKAKPRDILRLRRETIGYISQFLRVIPRVPTLQIVAEPLRDRGESEESANEKASELLSLLNIPENLWSLSPVTFSGGEQQRVNIARGFIARYPLLLLDEPTASLDANNRNIVIDLILKARKSGVAVIGIFHDEAVRDAVSTRVCDLRDYRQEIHD